MDDLISKFIKPTDKAENELVIISHFKPDFTLQDAGTAEDIIETNRAEIIRFGLTMAFKYPHTAAGKVWNQELAKKLISEDKKGTKGNRVFKSLNGLTLDQLKALEAGELDVNDLILDSDGVYKTLREVQEKKNFMASNQTAENTSKDIDKPDVGRV